jgi:uncharacterized protein YjiS (DUF1127 family)
MATTHSMPARSYPNTHGLGGVFKTWWDAYWTRRAQRSTVMILRSLDDHSLHDIGLDRSEIESVVYGRPGDRRLRYRPNRR